jgi:predicted nuclease with TOPRIM domain
VSDAHDPCRCTRCPPGFRCDHCAEVILAKCNELVRENDALRLAVAGRDKALALSSAGLESATAELDRLKQENRALRAEVERLRAVVSELQFYDRRD